MSEVIRNYTHIENIEDSHDTVDWANKWWECVKRVVSEGMTPEYIEHDKVSNKQVGYTWWCDHVIGNIPWCKERGEKVFKLIEEMPDFEEVWVKFEKRFGWKPKW